MNAFDRNQLAQYRYVGRYFQEIYIWLLNSKLRSQRANTCFYATKIRHIPMQLIDHGIYVYALLLFPVRL